jgi:hypothetical protein
MCDYKAELEILRARIEAIENQLQAKSRRGTRLPDGWKLPSEYREWANNILPEKKFDYAQRCEIIRDQAERFFNYWTAQSGSKGVKADWFATWKNWIKNSQVMNAKTSNDSRSRAQRHSDKLDEIAKRDVAENGFANHLDSGHI